MGSAQHDSGPRRFPSGGGVPAPQSLAPASPLVRRLSQLSLYRVQGGGIPRQLEAKVGSIAAFRNPSPAPASLASLYLSGPSPGACPSPALCGSAVWPLKGNVGRACGSDGHTVVGASPAARLRSLLLPFSWETQMVDFSVSPYPPGPNLSALSCCWGERAPPCPCGSRVCFPCSLASWRHHQRVFPEPGRRKPREQTHHSSRAGPCCPGHALSREVALGPS